MARWLHAAFALQKADAAVDDHYAFRWACENDHFALARWLHTTFALEPADGKTENNQALRGACERGQLGMARWLCETCGSGRTWLAFHTAECCR